MADPDNRETDNPLTNVPLEITVSVGHARPTIGEMLHLEQDAVLSLDRRIEDPVELYIGERLIARGELQEIDDEPSGQLAVRLTEVIDLKAGL